MLADDISEIRVHAKKAMNLNGAKKLRVTAPGGTDLSFGVRQFRALPFIIERNCRHIFLPASEVFTAIMEGSAEGHIVVDLTVGEFVFEGEKWDHLGKVDEPVLLIVKGGVITSIKGGTIARRLDACLQRCDMKCRIIVELGIGLSKGFVTGCIGSDECLRGTCHFGIGDNKFYGGTNKAPVHLDVVIDCPTFEILE
jgi:leucyl aminopeptidase (aminopeptidase T)